MNPRGDFSTTDNLVFKWRKFHIFINAAAAAAADTKFWSNIFLQIFVEKQAGPTIKKLFAGVIYKCSLFVGVFVLDKPYLA